MSRQKKRFRTHNLAAVWGDCKFWSGENSPHPPRKKRCLEKKHRGPVQPRCRDYYAEREKDRPGGAAVDERNRDWMRELLGETEFAIIVVNELARQIASAR